MDADLGVVLLVVITTWAAVIQILLWKFSIRIGELNDKIDRMSTPITLTHKNVIDVEKTICRTEGKINALADHFGCGFDRKSDSGSSASS